MEGASGRAAGGQLEEKVDLKAETDSALEQAKSLVKGGALAEALALLSNLEKRARVGNDNASLARICSYSLTACHDAQDQEALLETIEMLATRRSQKSAALQALVDTALPWVVEEGYTPKICPNKTDAAFRDKLVVKLRDITDGKLFLEKQRAQLTRTLAQIHEDAGEITEAARVLQDVHVETYGSLSKREKVDFILCQLRLTNLSQDFVRAAIVANKINRKTLDEYDDAKIHFYYLLMELHRHSQDAFELFKDNFAIYGTPKVQADPELWKPALSNVVLFLALSEYSNEQVDMWHRLQADPKLAKVPVCKEVVANFLKPEIIHYPMPAQETLQALPAFSEGGLAEHWKTMFHKRIIQHNIRVVAKYYSKIHGARLAELLGLDIDRLEAELADMVRFIYLKIDRPNDIVRFRAPQTPETILSDWSSDIEKLLDLVETTTHLIHKEQMNVASSSKTHA